MRASAARLNGLRKKSQMGDLPWESGPSGPRKACRINAGFSPCARLSEANGLFPQPLKASPDTNPFFSKLMGLSGGARNLTARLVCKEIPLRRVIQGRAF